MQNNGTNHYVANSIGGTQVPLVPVAVPVDLSMYSNHPFITSSQIPNPLYAQAYPSPNQIPNNNNQQPRMTSSNVPSPPPSTPNSPSISSSSYVTKQFQKVMIAEDDWSQIQQHSNLLKELCVQLGSIEDSITRDDDTLQQIMQTSNLLHQVIIKAHKAPAKLPPPLHRPKVNQKRKRTNDSILSINSSESSEHNKNVSRRQRAKSAPSENLYCRSCGEMQTCEWRRGPDGFKSLCNACGIHYAKIVKKEESEVATYQPKKVNMNMLLNENDVSVPPTDDVWIFQTK